jgi:PEP-CTERM motif
MLTTLCTQGGTMNPIRGVVQLLVLAIVPTWAGHASAHFISFVEPPNDTGSKQVSVLTDLFAGTGFSGSVDNTVPERALVVAGIPGRLGSLDGGEFVELPKQLFQISLLEPGSHEVSDNLILTISQSNVVPQLMDLVALFESDVEGRPPLPQLPTTITETGDLQLVVSVGPLVLRVPTATGGFSFQEFTLDVNVLSDAPRVPQPDTLTLLGSGLAGLAGAAWRLRRQK